MKQIPEFAATIPSRPFAAETIVDIFPLRNGISSYQNRCFRPGVSILRSIHPTRRGLSHNLSANQPLYRKRHGFSNQALSL
jgi:hypothetical protein